MLTNLVRELDDHDLSVLHTRNTQNGLVGVACVNPLHKKISHPAKHPMIMASYTLRSSAMTPFCFGYGPICTCNVHFARSSAYSSSHGSSDRIS